MKKQFYLNSTIGFVVLALFFAAPVKAADHPFYLHALSDLRAARWMIEHRPGNWEETVDEIDAVRQIDAAIKDIKEASIEDNKNIDDHPPVDERNDHNGRLHEAVDFLKKAHEDINHEEDDSFASLMYSLTDLTAMKQTPRNA